MALGAVAFSLGVVLSYALQRLWSAWGEPAPGVIAQEHIPLYWRFGLASLNGLVLAVMVALGVSEPAALRWLDRAPWLTLAVVLPAVLAMIWAQ